MSLTQEVIAAAQAAWRKWNVPASVSLAQFGLESSFGVHMPVGSHNPFGIKASGAQDYVIARTREERKDGTSYYIDAKFRKFANFAEAFDAHGQLLATASPYAAARAAWSSTHNVENYVREMAKRYATDHNYANSVMGIIRSKNLTQYDAHPGAAPPDIEPVPPPKPAMHPAIKIGGGAVIAGGIAASSGPDWMIWLGIAALVIGAGVALYFLFTHKETTP